MPWDDIALGTDLEERLRYHEDLSQPFRQRVLGVLS